MSKAITSALFAAITLCFFPSAAFAVIWTAPIVLLDGLSEVPPNASPGLGSSSAFFDDVTNILTVSGSYSGLITPVTAAHVHGPAPVGVNAGVLFGIPNTGGTSGTFSANGAVLPSRFFGDLLYINVHTSTFPAGEIRGQIIGSRAVPEPGTWAIMGGCVALAGGYLLRRRLGA
jgi:hypothetical protein